MKFKIIENEMPEFEKELNKFISQENIQVVDIKYSTSGLAPDLEQGWTVTNMHNALISYREVVKEEEL